VAPSRGKAFGVKFSFSQNDHRTTNRQLFDSFQEAKVFWAKTKSGDNKKLDEIVSSSNTSGMTFSQLLQDFEKYEVPTKALSTQIKYRSFIRHFGPLHHLIVERIQPTDIDKLIVIWRSREYLSSQRVMRCNYDHEFTLLKGVFNFYVDRYNRNYKLPFIKSHSKAIVVKEKTYTKKDLTLDQYELFLDKLRIITQKKKADIVFFLAQVQYGIYGRIQEAAALHFEDFNFNKRIVRIDKKVVWLRRKGMTDYIERGSKTNSGREIVMTTQLEQVWREWALKSGKRTGPMFQTENGVIPFRMIQHYYDKAFKLAGLNVRGTHVMRHASLSEAYEASHDILAVQALAGHRDLKTTSRYAKTRDKALHEAVNKLSEKISDFRKRTSDRGTQRDAN
jgi:integrase